MSHIEKVRLAEQRIMAVAQGEADSIDCPFCGWTSSPETQLLCCELLSDMTMAVLERIESGRALEMAERAMERLDKVQHRQNALVSIN